MVSDRASDCIEPYILRYEADGFYSGCEIQKNEGFLKSLIFTEFISNYSDCSAGCCSRVFCCAAALSAVRLVVRSALVTNTFTPL